MNSSMEKISSNKVKLRLELEAEAFEEAVQKAYLKMRNRINVPGFRKGKAPRAVIERMYGEGVFYEEAFDLVFPDMYRAAVEENHLEVVDQPSVDIETMEKGKNLVAIAEVFVSPDVELGAYKGLDVQRGTDEVDEEAVDHEIEQVRQRNAREIEVEDRPVQDDDIVNLDYAGSVDGVPFEGGTAQGQTLTIGSGSFIPGFEEQMVGMNIGEEKDLNVTFPEKYHAENLAGKNAVFHVKVNSIHTRELPALDDEFAKDVSEFDTLDEYKKDVRAKLEEQAKKQADAQFENELVEAVVKESKMDIPQAMIERKLDEKVQDLAMRMAYQGMRFDDFLKYTGQTEAQVRDQFRDDATDQVRGELVIKAIRKAENLEPTEEEIDDVIGRYAKASGKDFEEFKKSLNEQQMEYVKEDAATIAVLNLLKKEAKKAE